VATIPQSLRDAKHFIREKTAETAVMSIRANRGPNEKFQGYHAGFADIYGPYGLGDDAYFSELLPSLVLKGDVLFELKLVLVPDAGAKFRGLATRLIAKAG